MQVAEKSHFYFLQIHLIPCLPAAVLWCLSLLHISAITLATITSFCSISDWFPYMLAPHFKLVFLHKHQWAWDRPLLLDSGPKSVDVCAHTKGMAGEACSCPGTL